MTHKGWLALMGDRPFYFDGNLAIYLQRTKPKVWQDGKNLKVVPIVLTYKLLKKK